MIKDSSLLENWSLHIEFENLEFRNGQSSMTKLNDQGFKPT
jgi:hypothetical protein